MVLSYCLKKCISQFAQYASSMQTQLIPISTKDLSCFYGFNLLKKHLPKMDINQVQMENVQRFLSFLGLSTKGFMLGYKFYILFYTMLTVKLDTYQDLDLSRSSYNDDELDLRKLTNVIEQQKRTIRRLTIKIQKLEETLKKEREEKASSKNTSLDSKQNEHLLTILKNQIDKTRQGEELLNKIFVKLKQMANQAHFDRFFQPNPQNKPRNRLILEKNSPNFLTNVNIQSKNKNQAEEKQEAQRVLKQLLILQKGIKLLNENCLMLQRQNQQLFCKYQKVQRVQQLQETLKREIQNRNEIQKQLDAEKRMRVKLKCLLDKSQCQKNILLMKIERLIVSQKDNKQRKREEWVYISKSLNHKISDLEKQKRQMQEESTREKQNWTKKYGELLQTVKSMQAIRK